MAVNWIDLVAIAFGIFNILRLASYFPQIAAVARDQHGATAISLSCWSIWIGANGTTALYAWVNLGDFILTLISAFNAACCAIVLLLALYKRATVRIQQAKPSPHIRRASRLRLGPTVATAMYRVQRTDSTAPTERICPGV